MAELKEHITAKELKEILQFDSVRRVQQLAEDGIINTVEIKENGKKVMRYELIPTIKAYIKYLQTKAYGREQKKASEKELLVRKLQADVDYKESKAQMVQLQLDELEGRMHAAEDVEAMTTDLCLAVRSALLAMPGQLSKDVAEETDPAKIQIIIKDAISMVLNELAGYKYDKENYKKRVAERQGWQVVNQDGTEEWEEP